jgi:4-hydroxybenzoate polyprenyltransferase
MSDIVAGYRAPLRSEVTGWPKTLGLCFAEARPVVQVIFGLRFVSGAALAWWHGGTGNPGRLIVGLATWACATLFVYLFNGVMDVAEDQVNGSSRPIARGDLDPEVAGRVAYWAAALSTCGGFLLGPETGWLVVAFLAFGYFYSGAPFFCKNYTGGTLAMATLGGIVTYAGGYSVAMGDNGGQGSMSLLLFACVMSLWMGVVGALSKDFSDVAGDRAAGRRTGVVCWGEANARLVVALAALSLGATFVLVAAHLAPTLMLSSTVLLSGACVVAALALSRLSAGDRARRRRPYRAFMMTQYAVHLGLFAALAV